MKIVINVCFGGFGLSHKGMMAWAKRRGVTLYPFIQGPGTAFYEPYVGQSSPLLINYSTSPLTSGEFPDGYQAVDDIPRDDPDLVSVVEDLGGGANGPFAELRVVEIPDGVEWVIDEYDGCETVKEKHQSWR